jgi:hypothetical protein
MGKADALIRQRQFPQRVSGTSFGSPYWKVHPAVMAIRPTNRMSQRLPLWAGGGRPADDGLGDGSGELAGLLI